MDAPKTGEFAHIGKSVVVKGELSGSEDLYVDGHVEGSMSCATTAFRRAEWQYQGHGERQERRDPGQGGRRHQRFGASRTAKVRGCKWRCLLAPDRD